jgi:hypothetical protein
VWALSRATAPRHAATVRAVETPLSAAHVRRHHLKP